MPSTESKEIKNVANSSSSVPASIPSYHLSEYFHEMNSAVTRTLKGLLNSVLHPLDEIVYPLCGLFYDVHIVLAGQERLRTYDPISMSLRTLIEKYPEIHTEAAQRMREREDDLKKYGTTFLEASGPIRAGMITEVAVSIFTPGWAVKGVKNVADLRRYGIASPPRFSLDEGIPTNKLPALKPVTNLSVSEIRKLGNEQLIYVVTNNKLIVAESNFLHHYDLAKLGNLLAAGDVYIKEGRIVRLDNRSGGYRPQGEHLETLVETVFEKNGFGEVRGKFIDRSKEMTEAMKWLMPEDSFKPRIIYTNKFAPSSSGIWMGILLNNSEHRESATVKKISVNTPLLTNPVGSASTYLYDDFSPQVLPKIPDIVTRPIISQQLERRPAISTPITATFARQFWAAPHAPLPPRPVTPAAVGASLYRSLYQPPAIPFNYGKKSWLDEHLEKMRSYKSATSRVDDSQIRSALHSALSGSSLGDMYSVYMRVSSSLGSPINFSYGSFESMLRATGLVSSYQVTHPYAQIYSLLSDRCFTGGVETDVGIIEELKNSEAEMFDEAIFCVQTSDGRQPFSNAELKQLLGELAQGIFVHATFPFFSLDFNDSKSLFPLIHPAYQNTLVEKVIATLDYLMKCFLNGGYYDEEFLSTWHVSQNTDREYLKKNIKDFKSYCKAHGISYTSLRENISLIEERESKSSGSRSLKFRTSFRIISQQKTLRKHQNIFIINPDFRVESTVEPTPEYREELDQYFQIHNKYPADYEKTLRYYKKAALDVENIMPKLPLCRDYFHMLGVMGFFCYYFNTLKEMGKIPLLSSTSSIPYSVPKAYPPTPLRKYQFHPIRINAQVVFDKIAEKNKIKFSQWLTEAIEDSNHKFPDDLRKDLQLIVHEHIATQLPAGEMKELNDISKSMEMGIGDGFINDSIKKNLAIFHIHAQAEIDGTIALLKIIGCKFADIDKRQSLTNQIMALRLIINDSKVQYDLKSTKLSAPELDELKQAENIHVQSLLKKQAEEVAELRKEVALKPGLSVDEAKLELMKNQQIKEVHDFYQNKTCDLDDRLKSRMLKLTDGLYKQEHRLLNAIDYFHFKSPEEQKVEPIRFPVTTFSILDQHHCREVGDNLDIVGGCNVILPNLKPHSITEASAFMTSVLPIMQAAPSSQFSQVIAQGKKYSVFKLPIKPKCTYDRSVHADLVGAVEIESKTPKMGAKELSALSLFVTTAVEKELFEKKKTEEVAIPDFNATATDAAGLTMSHYLASFSRVGRRELLDKVIKGDIRVLSHRDRHGNLPIHIAAESGNLDLINYFGEVLRSEVDAQNNNGYTPLILAAQAGRLAVVDRLLQFGANPQRRVSNGLTALYLAIQNFHADTALRLINRENINFALSSGVTPLHIAIETKQLNVALELIRSGANVALKRRSDGFTSLHMAADLGMAEVCKAILGRIDVNFPLPNGKTALHLAAEQNHVEALQELMESKSANANSKDHNGETPIMSALRLGQTEAALFLAEHQIVNLVNKRNQTASLLAAQHGQFIVADRLIARGESPLLKDDLGNNYLYYILMSGESGRYQALCKSRIFRIDPKDKIHHLTHLDIAAKRGHSLLFTDLYIESKEDIKAAEWRKYVYFALKTDDIAFLKKLAKSKHWSLMDLFSYEVPGQFFQQKRLPYIAAEEGSEKCLRWLLSLCVDWHSHNKQQYIDQAVYRHHLLYAAIISGKPNIIDCVLDHCDDINIDITQYPQISAAVLVAQQGLINLVELMYRRGADFTKTYRLNGLNAFHYAIFNDDEDVLKKLFEITPKENWPENLYRKALEHKSNNCLDVIYEMQIQVENRSDSIDLKTLRCATHQNDVDEIKKLLAVGVKPLEMNSARYHPLNIAAVNGSLQACQLLLDISDPTSQMFALFSAVKNTRIEIILLFWEAKKIALLNADQMKHCIALAKDNRYTLAALRGERREYDRDKVTLIEALKCSSYTVFKRIIEQRFPIDGHLFRYDEMEQPLLHCVIDAKATWALPILRRIAPNPTSEASSSSSRFNPFEKDSKGYTLLQKMLISFEDESKADETTSPFVFYDTYLKEDLNSDQDDRLFYEKTPEGLCFSDLAAMKNHPDTYLFFTKHYMYQSLFSSAVKYNRLEWVKKLLIDNHVNANLIGEKLQSPLMIAALLGHLKMMQFLLTQGADPELIDYRQNTALHYAVSNKKVELALQLIAVTKNRDRKNRMGLTPLMIAAQQGLLTVVKTLCHLNANFNAVNEKGFTALHLASSGGHIEVVDYLIQQGVIIDVRALQLAANKGVADVFARLAISDANLTQKDQNGLCALDYAILYNKPEIWRLVENMPVLHDPKHQSRFFLSAAMGNNIAALTQFLMAGCNIDTQQENGHGALHFACVRDAAKAVAFLIDHNISMDISAHNGNTALHEAVQHGRVGIMRQLCDAKINVDAKNLSKQTALHIACEQKSFPAVLQLLKAKANIAIYDANGHLPVHIALLKEDWRMVNLFFSCKIMRKCPIPADVKTAYDKFLRIRTSVNFIEDNTNPEIVKIISIYDSMPPSLKNELPTRVHIVDENREIIAVYTNLSDAEKLSQLRSMVGPHGIRKLIFQPIYEISHAWIMQVEYIKIKNDQGINELAEILGTTKSEFRSKLIEPYEKHDARFSMRS